MKFNTFSEDNQNQAVLALSSIGDGVITTNASGKITFLNQAAEEILGICADDLFGKEFDLTVRFYNSDTNNQVISPVRNSLLKGTVSGLENNTIILMKDNLPKFVSATCSPIKTSSGETTGAVIVLRDITRIKSNENSNIKEKNSLTTIFTYTPVGMIVMNFNGEIIRVNDAALAYIGQKVAVFSKKDMEAFQWSEIVHPEDVEQVAKVMFSGKVDRSFQLECRLRRHDGKFRWCLIAGSPYYDMDGRYAGYIGSVYDINDQKEIEENLRGYRKIIDNAQDIIFFLDTDGRILEANKKAVATYGYTPEELKTMKITDIRVESLIKQDYDNVDKIGSLFESIHQRKDGSRFPVEVITQETDFGDNRIILKVIRDITERKKTETKVLENQFKYRGLFMNMQSGFAYFKIVYDEDQKIVDLKYKEINEAYEKLFNVRKKRIINCFQNDVFPSSKEPLMRLLNTNAYKLARGETVHISEAYIPELDRWFSFNHYSPKKNELASIVTDITEMKRAELRLTAAKEAAEAANRAKSEFLANMSHEIRTPINGIVGMVDLTLLTDLTEEQRENLETSKSCANSLLNIINDVLDFSKMEAGKLTIENVNFVIKDLIEEIVKAHTPRTEEKGLELNYSFSSSIPKFVIGDPNRIRQIINNLISNALKYTEKGSITVAVKKLAEYGNEIELKFVVSDTGIGISQEDMSKLFRSFSQVETSYTRKYGGTGLGLAISKNLIEMMGGKIGVESQKGVGSTFYFSLKLQTGHSDVNVQHKSNGITKASKLLRILLTEDDPINQSVITKMLQKKGHEVDTAGNGKEALELYKCGKYDVILMDIQMPVMNGMETTMKIRELEASGHHTPIVAITAYALQGDRERFLSLGMDEYITKPIQMEQLFDTLDKITPVKLSDTQTERILFSIARDIELLDAVLKYNDLLKIETTAHDIKLLAGMIDAEELKDEAFRIELAAKRGNLKEATEFVRDIRAEFITYKTKDEIPDIKNR